MARLSRRVPWPQTPRYVESSRNDRRSHALKRFSARSAVFDVPVRATRWTSLSLPVLSRPRGTSRYEPTSSQSAGKSRVAGMRPPYRRRRETSDRAGASGRRRPRVLVAAPVVDEIAEHRSRDMETVVVHLRRLRVLLADRLQQPVFEWPATCVVRHLESAVLAGAVAVRVQRDERVGDVPGRDGGAEDVDGHALRFQERPDALGDVEVDVDLLDAVPGRAGLHDEPRELIGDLVQLPVPHLDAHLARTGGRLRLRDAHRPRLHDDATGWRDRR